MLVAISAGVAHAGFGLSFGGGEAVIKEDLKIPGDSPLQLCDKSHDEDILAIKSVDLAPNPPQACVLPATFFMLTYRAGPAANCSYASSGQELVIKASGIVSEPVEEGAYVALQVKYGLIRLISTKADLCEQVKNVDMECPIEAGPLTITKSVDLPKEIPNVSAKSCQMSCELSTRLTNTTGQIYCPRGRLHQG